MFGKKRIAELEEILHSQEMKAQQMARDIASKDVVIAGYKLELKVARLEANAYARVVGELLGVIGEQKIEIASLQPSEGDDHAG